MLQASHTPLHAVLQQKPSTQFPPAQSAGALQVFGVLTPASGVWPVRKQVLVWVAQ